MKTADIPLNTVTSRTPYNVNGNDGLAPLRSKEAPSHAHKHTHPSGHRVKRDPRKKTGSDGEVVTVNRVGRFYRWVMDFSVITRYFLFVTPLALCIAVPIVIGATLAEDAKIGGVRIVWFFTWIEIVWLSLWVSKVVCHFLPIVFQVLAGVVSSGTRKYAVILRSLEIPLSLVGWSVTSLATFVPLMTRNPTNRADGDTTVTSWETIVERVLAAAVASTLVLLVEKFLIQLISINYHRKQFNSRIKDSKRNIYILGLLFDASRALFPMYCTEFAEEDYTMSDQLDLRKVMGSKGHSRSGSATPMRLLQDVGRFGDKVTSLFGNIAQEITGKQVFNPNSAHSIVITALEKRRTSAALARRLWMSFVMEGKDALYEEDLIEVLGHDYVHEAEEAFSALDRDANGDISLDEMILTVTEIGRERKAIASSMHDVDQAITVLDRLLLSVVCVAVVFIFIAFLNSSFVTTLATAGTALLSLSFVFSVTCQEVLGSCIFVFVKHPYDVGDRVDINSEQLIVDHISLLFCVFRRVSGDNCGRVVQVPNIILNTLWIENVSRSKAMKEQLSISVSYDTTFEEIQLLKSELLAFVRQKDNQRDFQQDLEVDVIGTSDLSKLELRVEISHKSNWSNETVRAARRSKFMCALIAAMRRVPINAPGGGGGEPLGSVSNATYSVALTPDIAERYRDDAKAKAEKTKLANKKDTGLEELGRKTSRSSSDNGFQVLGLSKTEGQAMDSINARDPAADAMRDDVFSDDKDDSTLNERPNIDRRDEDSIRGILRRESTKGRRRANTRPAHIHYAEGTSYEPSDRSLTRDYSRVPADADDASGQLSQQYSNSSRQVPPPLSTINSLRSLHQTNSPSRQGSGAGAASPSGQEMPRRGPSNYRRPIAGREFSFQTEAYEEV